MVRSIVGVIVGYVSAFILQVIVFMGLYSAMGPDRSFKPASFDASTRWTLAQFAVIFVTSAIAGLICAMISQGGKAPLVLAAVILVLGIALGALATSMRPTDTHEVRTGNVPNMEAMSKARHPMWVIFLGPVIGALGAAAGGKLKRN